MTDDRQHERREDPDPSEIEVDEANELFGGPSTESLEAGLSSKPAAREAAPDRSKVAGESEEDAEPDEASDRN